VGSFLKEFGFVIYSASCIPNFLFCFALLFVFLAGAGTTPLHIAAPHGQTKQKLKSL
jgi:hypothetical protein